MWKKTVWYCIKYLNYISWYCKKYLVKWYFFIQILIFIIIFAYIFRFAVQIVLLAKFLYKQDTDSWDKTVTSTFWLATEIVKSLTVF